MPVIRQIEAGVGLDTGAGTVPSTRIDPSGVEGLAQLGRGVGQVAEAARSHELRLVQQKQQMAEFAADQGFERLSTQFAAQFAEDSVNIAPSGEGFTETVATQFRESYDQFLRQVPPELQPKFSELALNAEQDWIAKAAATEADQRNTWYRTGVTDTVDAKQDVVFENPAQFQAALADVYRTIDASGLPPTEKETLRKAAEASLGMAVGDRYLRDDPEALKDALGVSEPRTAYFDAIRSAESGGNDQAANPNSTAFGRYQFTQGTWNGLVARYPNAGLTANGRSNPAQQEIAIRLFTADNERALAAGGIPTTNANLYAAHFLGVGDAIPVLRGPDDTKMSSYVSEAVIEANPFLRGMTVGQFKNWAANKTGRSGDENAKPAPEFAGLDFSERLALYDRATARQAALFTEAQAQQRAQYDALKGSLQLGIQTGEVASERTILDSGLNDADKASLINSYRTERKEAIAVNTALAEFQNGSLSLDPYDTDDRKTVDGMYEAITKAVPAEAQQFVTDDLIRQAGVVPTQMHNSMRRALDSTNPGEVEPALIQAARIANISPGILGRRDGGADIQSKADLFNAYTQVMGYSPTEAAQKVAASNDPEKVRERDALLKSTPVTNLLKGVNDRTVSGLFPALPMMGIDVGTNPAQSAAMVSEYKSILEESVVDADGDLGVAQELAKTRFTRVYGPSEMSLAGAGVVTRLPPEKTYDPLPDGSYGYIRDQLVEALESERDVFTYAGNDQTGSERPLFVFSGRNAGTARAPEANATPTPGLGSETFQWPTQGERPRAPEGATVFDDVRLVSYDDTDTDFNNGRPARYQVYYLSNGQWNLYRLPFVADYQAALANYQGAQAEQRAIDLQDAQIRREQNLTQERSAVEAQENQPPAEAVDQIMDDEWRSQNETLSRILENEQ